MTILVLAGALCSILGARAVARSDANQKHLAIHLASSEIASTLKLAISHEKDLVVSASAFASANPEASAASFDRWVDSVQAMSRYGELENLGLVQLIPAAQLPAFRARLSANPILPLGPTSAPLSLQNIIPSGARPYYCLASAGVARSPATEVPAGFDYCALVPAMVSSRDSGVSSYAPVQEGTQTLLGVEAPVYVGGVTPSTVAARHKEFVGWIGELMLPNIVIAHALQGQPNLAVTFSYHAPGTDVAFSQGTVPAHAERTAIDVETGAAAGLSNSHDGWTVQTFAPPVVTSIFASLNALAIVIGGTLLSVLLGILVLVLGTGRTRALSLVIEKTKELSHQALHDALTDLPNRALVLDRAEQMLARASRDPELQAGALFIDIDGFKYVNDNLGHAAGDQLLQIVGKRLSEAAREGDTVGRLGGDEFVVLVEALAGDCRLDAIADRLTAVLREPIALEGGERTFSVTASIGVAVGKYATPDALLRDADLALYAAKAAGKDRYALFESSMYDGSHSAMELDADLAHAVDKNQLFLVYQPIFGLPHGEITGAEALVRWMHPTRGLVMPDEFIPLAEENGTIVAIGRWVLREACRQAAQWAGEGRRLEMSVNVSAQQLGRSAFLDDLRGVLTELELDPTLLTLELTETTLIRNVDAVGEQLAQIRALGVRVAIDDFGTGYASLSHLQRIPVDVLKIDRSFIAALNEGGRSRDLLEAILGVGKALSLSVVAEGVEDHSQLNVLEEMGCEMAQGYLMARPGPPADTEALASHRVPPGKSSINISRLTRW